MFCIRNSAENTEIDIIGAIGEDWFGEGNTLETVRNQFATIENDVTVNVSSLGGDLIHALAIHDMFKAHKHRVTTNIIGATASAGTIIALGGDNIKISENSLFLGHKASLMAWGNADDLRAAAEDLDKFDSRIIAIYKKKTGKTKAEIEDWLKEDKWITATEAKDFGLVDEVYKTKKVLNKAEITELSNIKELPINFNKEMENENSLKMSILNLIGFKNDETIKAENIALKEEVDTLKANKVEPIDVKPYTVEIENLKRELTEKADYDAIKAELETAKADLAKALASATFIPASADPNPTGEPKPFNEGQKIIAEILANVPEHIKTLYAKQN